MHFNGASQLSTGSTEKNDVKQNKNTKNKIKIHNAFRNVFDTVSLGIVQSK